ncbi:protein adenylyltransferase SelO [Alkalibacillus aidingensis]|uniref:protein adenylyltransferase SelO n=1 Tax=Alkalibacillus aidingensis TaxID=2747607 RepID=UPI0016607536|nr:YdiU family protein [Alkalibacillus aidingensis]
MVDENNVGWNFDNSYTHLPEMLFSEQEPTPVKSPSLVILNESLANSLGLDSESLRSDEGVSVFAGNQLPEGSKPIAQAYAGHQFGHFTMLGDGRAVLLGEQITPHGDRFDIQLKGSGRTPYSRGGDGRAVLGPMLREYIISEAMHALGIPSNRSLAVVTTGEPVIRETEKPGAILTRVSSSHIRVGTFQYVANQGAKDDLRTFADYTIERHYPGLKDADDPYLSLLEVVIKNQAFLISKWQLVGFIHGVMNTDNITISGESIDFGPCAFMNSYDPATVFSSIDREGRYAYGNQPKMAMWGLARFAESLLQLLHDDDDQAVEIAQNSLTKFKDWYHEYWLRGMRAKLGIFNEEDDDEKLFEELLKLMYKHEADFTNTFRALTYGQFEGINVCDTREFEQWHEKWQTRLDRQEQSDAESKELMRQNNPAVIPRNHKVEEALEAAEENGDYSVMDRLLAVLSSPYDHSIEQTEYTSPPPDSDRPYRTYCGT